MYAGFEKYYSLCASFCRKSFVKIYNSAHSAFAFLYKVAGDGNYIKDYDYNGLINIFEMDSR